MSKVSVVTTVYNGAPYIETAAESILGQRCRNVEWLLVDDGSSDATPTLLAALAARAPSVRILSPGRVGRARALNLGVENASGEYIGIQDIDDTSRPDRLRLQCEFLDRNADAGLVGGFYEVADRNRGERYVRMPPTSHEDIVCEMAKSIPFAHTVVMFRKAAWAQTGGYPELEDCEDLAFFVELAAAGWLLANIPEILGTHYVHGKSFWHQNFNYLGRQVYQARVHAWAIRKLGLPFWMTIYPAGRLVYPTLPEGLKRLLRRSVAESRERDLGGLPP